MGIVFNYNLALLLLTAPIFTSSVQENAPVDQEAAAPIKVAVVLNERRAEYTAAIKGMEASLHGRVDVYDLKGQPEKASKVLTAVQGSGPDLIVALGTSAYQAVKSKKWDIPVMFSMVAYPEKYTEKGEMPFGVSLHLDPYEEMKFVRDLCGENVKAGIIYDPAISKDLVERRIKSAKVFDIEVIALPAATEVASLEAVDKLKEEVDLFFLIPDPVMVSKKVFERLKLESFRRSLPIIGFSESYLLEDCLAFVRPDFEALGRLTGEKAKIIVKADRAAGIVHPKEIKIGINLKVAERLGFKIPEAILKRLKPTEEAKE